MASTCPLNVSHVALYSSSLLNPVHSGTILVFVCCMNEQVTVTPEDERLLPAQEEDKAKDWLLQYKHVAFTHGMFRAATVVLLLTQLAGISTAFTSLIRVRG